MNEAGAEPESGEWVGEVHDPVTPDFRTQFYRHAGRLVLRTDRASTGSSGERTWPLAAARWLHDAIAHGFWRAPEAGGFDRRTTRVEAVIEGERLELRRAWGLGGPDGLGFIVTNHDRKSPGGYPEEYPMTDEVLITGGLLALLVRVAESA